MPSFFPPTGLAPFDFSVPLVRVRKKPVEVLALKFNGLNHQQVIDWVGADRAVAGVKDGADLGEPPTAVFIHTLEGDMRADVGDWIIKGVKGEFYPCKPDIFAETYELVTD